MDTLHELSRAELESRYRRFRLMTVVLAILCAFLGVTLAGQLALGSSPRTSGAAPEGSAATPGTDGAESSDGGSDASPQGTAGDSRLVERDPDDPMAMGDVDAPVVLIQWTDLRCPFCAAYHRDTLPTIIEEYVDEGMVRLEFHDVAYFGEQSEDASVAARAAAKQGKYVEYLDAVYAAAPETGHPDLPRETLIGFAETAGVPDMESFTADLDDPEIRSRVQEDTASAQSIGVSAVPFFLAGDTALSGAQPLDVFREYLDQAVDRAE